MAHTNFQKRSENAQASYIVYFIRFIFATFANRIESLKTPSNYILELGKHVQNKKFGALKSYNYHILMQ